MSELKQPSSSYVPQAEEKSADGEIFTVCLKRDAVWERFGRENGDYNPFKCSERV